jgi:hypothetical protein
MDKLFNKFWWPSREHVGEDVLLSLLDGELPASQTRKVQKHLERCWTCRARRGQLEQSIGHFIDYRRQVVGPFMPPPARGRELFLARLEELRQVKKQPWYSGPVQALRQFHPQTMTPIIASALVICVAAGLLFAIWQRSLPPVSAHDLLEKAQGWDAQPSPSTHPAVVYQRVAIRTKTKQMERAIYRDVTGKRQPHAVALDATGSGLKHQLEAAGVIWQEPLSAASFRDWHDRQPGLTDLVTRSGDSLLTLTTSVPSGLIASESLTVRANDFHPVGRTIELRGEDRIEIAELNYAILGWNEVNEALFEPLTNAAPAIASIRVPPAIRPEQLDLAELEARLVLSRLNADSTEQLDFSRSNTAVQVKGIVETTQRKNVLVAQLRQVPYVVPAIFSIDELNARRAPDAGTSSIREYSVVGQPSPLESYFKAHGKDQDAVSEVSHGLLDAAASVRQESGAIHDLLQRFAAESSLGDEGKAVLNELIHRHTVRLLSALDEEHSIIGSNLSLPTTPQSIPKADNSTTTLLALGDHNVALCREFISGSSSEQRPAEVIASDLIASTEQLRALLHSLPGDTRVLPPVPPSSPKN